MYDEYRELRDIKGRVVARRFDSPHFIFIWHAGDYFVSVISAADPAKHVEIPISQRSHRQIKAAVKWFLREGYKTFGEK